jgi:signal transduction histidine kinase
MADGNSSFEWIHTRLDGQEFPANISLTRVGWGGKESVQATVRDVSVSKRLEAEQVHNHKLEAVGQLAAGIAHEINTPAQYVGDGLHFLKEAFEGYQLLLTQYKQVVDAIGRQQERNALLETISQVETDIELAYLNENVPTTIARCVDGVDRIATIVRAMKEFAHPDQREMATADINQALQNALTIAKTEYKYVADVEVQLGSLPPVLCHIGDLSQVFLNLIVNAAHTIADVVNKEGGRGTIRISTQCDGNWVRVDISDSGTGIPPSIRQRVFDPFFTTKEVGKGTGQGLAISRSIVAVKHHGSLTFETIPGEGTTFTIRLPVDGRVGESMAVPA